MTQRVRSVLRKIGMTAVEMAMVVVMLLMVAAVLLMLRLQVGPLDLPFVKSVVQVGLNELNPDISVQMDRAVIEWAANDIRPRIVLNDVRLTSRATGGTILVMDSVGMTLSPARILLGEVAPRSIFIERPLLSVMRSEDGAFRLNMETPNAPEMSAPQYDTLEQSELLFHLLETLSADIGAMPHDFPLKALRRIIIRNAALRVEDYAVQESWLVPRLDMQFRKVRDGLMATATLWVESDRGEANVMLDAAYDRDNGMLLARLNLNGVSTSFLATKFPNLSWMQGQKILFNGTAELALDQKLKLHAGSFNLDAEPGMVNLPSLYDTPLEFHTMKVRAAYDPVAKNLGIADVSTQIGDLEVSAKADLTFTENGIVAPITIRIPTLPQAAVRPIWPKPLMNENATPWILEHLSGGRVTDAVVNMVVRAERSGSASAGGLVWTAGVDDLDAAFGIKNMDIDYRAPLMKVKNANGSGAFSLKKDELSFVINDAVLGDLAVSEGSVVLDAVMEEGEGHAVIDLRLKGPLKTVFEYIRAEPIAAAKDFPVPLNKIAGNVDARVGVKIPMLADVATEDVSVSVDGILNDVMLPGLVSGLNVGGTGLKLKLSGNEVSVIGAGTIDGRAMNFRWAQFLDSAGQPYDYQVVADVVIDPKLRAHFGADLDDWVAGSAPAKITYTEQRNGNAVVHLNVDATPATLMVKPLQYVKKPGVTATASAIVDLGAGGVLNGIRSLSITAPDAKVTDAELKVRQTKDGPQIAGGTFTNARLADTIGTLTFSLDTKNVLRLDMVGPSFDARPFLKRDSGPVEEKEAGPTIVATIKTPMMYTHNDLGLRDATVQLHMAPHGDLNSLQVRGQVGQGDFIFAYKPDAQGRLLLNIDSNDAGSALRALGYYEHMRGGVLKIVGAPPAGLYRRRVDGEASITNFRIVKAPALARLLNAISLSGMQQLLGGDGIDFQRLQSTFTWEQRPAGSFFTIEDGRTSGSAIGLTFHGTIDEAKDYVDVKGTIVPVSGVNNFISGIPVLGTLITGGGGAVFAATYTMRGPANDLTTTVNPLAVLAPGFLRKLFFEGD